MLYLQLPPAAGCLANAVKESILHEMNSNHIGFLHAAEKLHISKAAAFSDYRNDKAFAAAVDAAEVALVMYISEEILSLSDSATSRENAAALSLKIKTREKMRDALLPKWREAKTQQHVEQHLHTGDTHISLSVEKQKELREQRRRILATVKGAHVLDGNSPSASAQEPPHSLSPTGKSTTADQQSEDVDGAASAYHVPRQSLLTNDT